MIFCTLNYKACANGCSKELKFITKDMYATTKDHVPQCILQQRENHTCGCNKRKEGKGDICLILAIFETGNFRVSLPLI